MSDLMSLFYALLITVKFIVPFFAWGAIETDVFVDDIQSFLVFGIMGRVICVVVWYLYDKDESMSPINLTKKLLIYWFWGSLAGWGCYIYEVIFKTPDLDFGQAFWGMIKSLIMTIIA